MPTDSRASPVAVITDIHGNLPALEAALDRIDELGISRVFCGGDLVGYGPHPNEVCALIAEREIPTIYGNYDYAIARDLDDCGCAYIDQHDRELGQQSVDVDARAHRPGRQGLHARAAVRPALRARRARGPSRARLAAQGQRVPVRGQARPALRAARRAPRTPTSLVFGHTHKPWIREFGGVLFVNCGSVGKPKDGDPRGAFAVLDLDDTGQVRARIERVAYDVEPVAREVVAAGLPSRVRRQAPGRRLKP